MADLVSDILEFVVRLTMVDVGSVACPFLEAGMVYNRMHDQSVS